MAFTSALTEEQCRLLGIEREQIPTTQSVPKSTTAGFITPSWYPALSYAMLSPSERGCTLYGPRGTGKSTAIRELARSSGMDYVTMQCAANMQVDSFIGSYGLSGGATVFEDGPLTIAVRQQCWLVLEEVNNINPGVCSILNTLTDKTGEGLRLPTGEVVPNGAGFRIALLFNEGYVGTREINPALRDRLMPIYTEYPTPDVEAQMLAGSQPHLSAKRVQQIINVAALIRAASVDFDLSVRALDRWCGLQAAGVGTWADCFRIAILDLTGDPKVSGPKRAVLNEIANQCSIQTW